MHISGRWEALMKTSITYFSKCWLRYYWNQRLKPTVVLPIVAPALYAMPLLRIIFRQV